VAGDHLRVDLGQLEECASALARLRSEFDHARDIADDAGAAVGNGHLRGALHDFATNWKYHRQQLGESITAITEMTENARRSYTDVDQKLATSLENAR
jgi:hypothetical protein